MTATSSFLLANYICNISLINIYMRWLLGDRYIYSDISKIPKANVAMVLGTVSMLRGVKLTTSINIGWMLQLNSGKREL